MMGSVVSGRLVRLVMVGVVMRSDVGQLRRGGEGESASQQANRY